METTDESWFSGREMLGGDTCEKKKVLQESRNVKNVLANRSDKELAMSPFVRCGLPSEA